LFDAYEPMHALVAEHDGKLIGLAHFLYHRSTIQQGPSCYLEDLFTSADVRGQGVGRKLVEAVYAAAQSAGSPQVYWHTHETNATAMRLYDQVAGQSGFLHYYHSFPSIPG
jgi:GNAT superfamily N-acetyltransferase